MSAEQKELIKFDPTLGFVFVNDHVYFSTEGRERVIFVHGIVFAHHDVSDRAAEAYAMVSLFETGYANQNDIARAFKFSARSLLRNQHGLSLKNVRTRQKLLLKTPIMQTQTMPTKIHNQPDKELSFQAPS